MEYEDMLFEKEDRVATITLNRQEKMNAFSPGMRVGMHRALADVAADDNIKVLIITGAGRAFCSGADVGGFVSEKKAGSPHWFELGGGENSRFYLSGFHLGPLIRGLDKPIIAAINGPAVGGGFGLAMSCDIRIASDQARLATGYVRMGLAVEWGISYIVPRLVGSSKALEILLTSDSIKATEAERIGLVNRVVPAQELMGVVRELANKIAAGPPFAIRQIKRAVQRALDNDYTRQIEYEAYVQGMCLETQDHKEAATAFLEKREPKFRGL